MAKVHDLYRDALEADKAFHEALIAEYGSQAGDRRYDNTASHPLHIQVLARAKVAADDDYRNEVKGNK